MVNMSILRGKPPCQICFSVFIESIRMNDFYWGGVGEFECDKCHRLCCNIHSKCIDKENKKYICIECESSVHRDASV